MGFFRILQFVIHHHPALLGTSMKLSRVAFITFGLCIIVILSSCKKEVANVPSSSNNSLFGISSKIRQQVSDNINKQTAQEQKISLDVLELIAQQKATGVGTLLQNNITTDSTITFSPAIIDSLGRVMVYLYLSDIPSKLKPGGPMLSISFDSSFLHNGAEITSKNDSIPIVQAWVAIDHLVTVAKFPEVTSIRLVTAPHAHLGTANDAGVRSIHADFARHIWSEATGQNIKVGVISTDCGSGTEAIDRVSGAQSFLDRSVAQGDLRARPTLILDPISAPGGSSSRNHEGLQMMEIVQAIAPEASLAFASGNWGLVDFANQIDALATAGCKVMTDDLLYDEEAAFEDGDIAKRIDNAVTTHNIVYTSSAGNFAKNVFSFTFNPAPSLQAITNNNYRVQSNTSGAAYPVDITIPGGGFIDIMLQWDDPFNNSNNDFDLFLVNKTNSNEVYQSRYRQNGSTTPLSQPFEKISFSLPSVVTRSYILYIAKINATSNPTPRMKLLILTSGISPSNPQQSSIWGHAASAKVLCCAAMPADDPQANGLTEEFSSQGPVPIVQTSVTIVGRNHPLVANRQKPDVTSVDGVQTSVTSYPFSGTSASAPQVAGLAAILLSTVPSLKNNAAAARLAIQQGCIRPSGTDASIAKYGAGKTDAFRTIAQTLQRDSRANHAAGFQSSKTWVELRNNRLTSSYTLNLGTTSTLSRIREMYVVVHLAMPDQTNGCRLLLESVDNPKRMKLELVNIGGRYWDSGVDQLYEIKQTNQTTPPQAGVPATQTTNDDDIIELPLNVLLSNATRRVSPCCKWKLTITCDNPISDPFFNFTPRFKLIEWGIYSR